MKEKNISEINIKQITETAKQGISSADGQRAIKKSLQCVREWTSKITNSQRIDQKKLHEPFTL